VAEASAAETKAAEEEAAAQEAITLAEAKEAKAEQDKANAEAALAAATTADEQAAAQEAIAAAEEAERVAAEEKAAQEAAAAAAAEAKKIAAEEKAAQEAVAAAAAQKELEVKTVNLFKITPESYFKNNNSVAKYKGNFNNTKYDSNEQYIKRILPSEIPHNTTISMDVDLGASKNHISNGKIEVKNSPFNYYDTTFEFDGKIKNAKKGELELEGTNGTSGKKTKAYLYGDKAQVMKGEVDLTSPDYVKIKGEFKANKDGFEDEDFITIDDITPESYFEDFNSVATYKGDFNNTSYNKDTQYIKNVNGEKVSIPTSSSISMDIDFGASKDQISNGKVDITDIGDGTSETLQFNGKIKNIKYAELELKGIKDITEGSGKAFLYGNEAEIMSGNVDFKSKTSNINVKGQYEATKQ